MANTGRQGGGNLFIVDNSVSRWTVLDYLGEWADLARSFDVATGFFEIGALLALDGKWQQLDKIRILMGDQVSLKTKRAFRVALHSRIGHLDADLEDQKRTNPFLRGVEAVVEAIKSGKIECRVYRKKKFGWVLAELRLSRTPTHFWRITPSPSRCPTPHPFPKSRVKSPVSLTEIRAISERIGKIFTALPSPQKVSDTFFATIYTQGSCYVS